MIDWFAAKLGLLIFVTVCAAAVLAFSLVLSANFRMMSAAVAARDIARLIDSMADGASLVYVMPLTNYTLDITGHLLAVDGIQRGFVSPANSSSISSALKLTIARRDGVVYVSPA